MKRIYFISLALAMFWSLCCPYASFASAPALNDPESELSFTTITMGNETMVIPVVVETTIATEIECANLRIA